MLRKGDERRASRDDAEKVDEKACSRLRERAPALYFLSKRTQGKPRGRRKGSRTSGSQFSLNR